MEKTMPERLSIPIKIIKAYINCLNQESVFEENEYQIHFLKGLKNGFQRLEREIDVNSTSLFN